MTDHDAYSDQYLSGILSRTKTIAMVGASDNPSRPSNEVLRYLRARGYKVLAVNPGLAGGTIDGAPVYGSLAEIPEPIDMVDVFRNNAAVPDVLSEVLALDPLPSTLWMQIGVRVDEAAEKAEAAGVDVVMDRCPKIEIHRLARD